MDTLSICIQTNRSAKNLNRCLESIKSSIKPKNFIFDVCISDNSLDKSKNKLIKKYQKHFTIKYKFFNKKTNRVANMINVVDQSKKSFVWLLGDDEIILKKSLEDLYKIFKNKNKSVDLIFLNSSFLEKNQKLPKNKKIQKFYDLINPNISPDFMGAMFVSVFRRSKWNRNKNLLNKYINNKVEFSNLGNTFPHLIVFTKAFMFSDIIFSKIIFTKNLIKNRVWSTLWPLVQSIRMQEVLDNYRKNGLPFKNYFICKNYSLKFFLPDFLKIIIKKNMYPISYFSLIKHFISNLIYPYFYFSPLNSLINKFKYK